MIGTEFQKQVLACRRDRRDRTRDGWEYVGEGGGMLWELYRGSRTRQRIVDVAIAVDGLGLWIKTAIPETIHPSSFYRIDR